MSGHNFVVSGDHSTARNTVYNALESQGFKVTQIDEWSAGAERGSSAASMLLGAFAGKKGRHVKLRVDCKTIPEGLSITLTQGTSGASGGLIGANQANTLYKEVYTAVSETFLNAGILLSEANL